MTVIATDTQRLGNWLKHAYEPGIGYVFETVTVNEAASKSYVTGAVVGKVTAGGKYKLAVQTAVDGSEVAAGIYVGDVLGNDSQTVAAATDTKVLVLKRGPAIVSKDALILDATYDLDAEKQAIYDALAALGILVNPTI